MAMKADLEKEIESLKISLKAVTIEKEELLERKFKLNKHISELKEEMRNLKNEIQFLKEDNERIIAECQLERSNYNSSLLKKEKEYETSLQMAKMSIEEKYQKLINEHMESTKNQRNAGRKSILTESLVGSIKVLSNEGKTQKLISEILNVSVGTVNKVLKNTAKNADLSEKNKKG